MKQLFFRNSITLGILLVVFSELVAALLLWVGLLIAGIPVVDHVRWFAIAFVPPILLLRYYAKVQEYPLTLRAIICSVFVTFVAFIWFMVKYHYITL
ncbi:MAG: hypothetical protein MJZ67_05915 [Bacteroidales bacterium]|nr:hypothetical protein [Bacteroidales bacterium]